MSSHAQFETALRVVYREMPCRTLPNAFWKTRAHIADCETHVWPDGGRITGLLMRSQDVLHVYWRSDRDAEAVARQQRASVDWERLSLALLHQDFAPISPPSPVPLRTRPVPSGSTGGVASRVRTSGGSVSVDSLYAVWMSI